MKNHRFWKKWAIGLTAAFLPLLLFRYADVLQGFELRVLSFLTYERGERAPHDDIIIVTVDDQTVAELGSPLPRRYYAELIQTLNKYGAKAIVFDYFFQELRDPKMDDSLAIISQRSNNVIHAFTVKMRGDGYDDGTNGLELDSLYLQYAIRPQNETLMQFFHADTALFPHPRFAAAFQHAGLATLMLDADERFQKLPLIFQYAGKIYPSLSLVALCKYLNVPADSLSFDKNFWGYRLFINTPKARYAIPIDRRGQMRLNFYGPFEAFPSYSVLQIRQALQDIQAGIAPSVLLPSLEGKIVFIGGTETATSDAVVTPFSAVFPGVGIFATATSNFFNHDSLRELPWHVDASLVLVFALILSGGILLADRIDKAKETVYAWLIFGGILLAFNLLAYLLLFKSLHIAPPMLQTNSALALFFIATTFYEKSWRVKTLNREVGRLENAMKEKLAEMNTLNAAISVRDDEYKTLNFLTKDFENLLNYPSAELTNLLQHPLARMHIIKEQIKSELEQLHDNKQRLEGENKALVSQMRILQETPSPAVEKPAAAVTPPEPPEKKLEDVRGVIEHYQTFVQKAKVKHHFDPALGMVTAVMNGRLEGEAQKNKMQDVFTQIAHFGSYDATVLITGETGTGKEVVARAIQKNSRRKQGPFIAINIAEFPENLIEDELFGHAKGAYTGAQGEREGAFERAHGGTIFLDEIGDLKYELQAKLLRVLQEKTVTRLGSNDPIKVDFRIIAATNHDLKKLIDEKRFREDLYYRLNVARLHLPALRERKDEIPHLVSYFLAKFNDDNKKQKRLNDDALTAMILHNWPGNIRELQNFLERAYIQSSGDTIGLGDLDEEIQRSYSEVFNRQFTSMWDGILVAAREELDRLLLQCQEILRAGNVEQALQAGKLRLADAPCKNCYEYMKAFLDSKGSLFAPDRRETLAKQTIVAMSEQLADWCGKQKVFDSMEQAWREIEKLFGRTRRQITNWKHEVGMPPFGSIQ